MKSAIKFLILFIALSSGIMMVPQSASAQVSVSFQVFYDDLSPHGNWVDYPNYGYVWVPNVSPGFTPYGSNGYWVFTDYGWTWVSNYSWGWAPFHYGRWHYDNMYGYLWVPGNEWGPGWVSWRQSEGYYGWAPIEPGISIELAYSSGYNVPNDRWTFVRGGDFGRTNINNYYVDRSSNTTIINNTTVINNVQSDRSSSVRYNAGPDRGQVQSRTGNTIAPVALRESSKPGQTVGKDEVQMYRPRVEKGNAAPTKVSSIRDVKSASERKGEAQPQKENQQDKAQPAQQQEKSQPAKEQPSQQQRKEQPAQQQEKNQPKREQPAQRQRNEQPAKQQPSQEQRNSQPGKEQQQRREQPAQQQPSPRQRNNQPHKEQPAQHQRREQPVKQQPSQQPPDPSQNDNDKRKPH